MCVYTHTRTHTHTHTHTHTRARAHIYTHTRTHSMQRGVRAFGDALQASGACLRSSEDSGAKLNALRLALRHHTFERLFLYHKGRCALRCSAATHVISPSRAASWSPAHLFASRSIASRKSATLPPCSTMPPCPTMSADPTRGICQLVCQLTHAQGQGLPDTVTVDHQIAPAILFAQSERSERARLERATTRLRAGSNAQARVRQPSQHYVY